MGKKKTLSMKATADVVSMVSDEPVGSVVGDNSMPGLQNDDDDSGSSGNRKNHSSSNDANNNKQELVPSEEYSPTANDRPLQLSRGERDAQLPLGNPNGCITEAAAAAAAAAAVDCNQHAISVDSSTASSDNTDRSLANTSESCCTSHSNSSAPPDIDSNKSESSILSSSSPSYSPQTPSINTGLPPRSAADDIAEPDIPPTTLLPEPVGQSSRALQDLASQRQLITSQCSSNSQLGKSTAPVVGNSPFASAKAANIVKFQSQLLSSPIINQSIIVNQQSPTSPQQYPPATSARSNQLSKIVRQEFRTVSSISSEEGGLGSTESDALLSGSRATSSNRTTASIINNAELGGCMSNSADDYNRRNRKRKRGFFATICCFCMDFSNCFQRIFRFVWRRKSYKPRNVHICFTEDKLKSNEYPPNIVRNQKYNIFTFLPIVLFNQFKFFLNLYFLLMACSQFIDSLKVGPIFTYWAPLAFVLGVTLIREAIDDLLRYKRDKAVNSQVYSRLTPLHGVHKIPSAKIRVGDIIQIDKDQRVPADMIFLRTSEKNGSCFIRTDQLDGETDWKLRLALNTTQELEKDQDIFDLDANLHAEEPRKDIHSFVGKFVNNANGKESPLSIENTLWANTVVASGTATGIVIYTGPETRSMMNNNEPRSKVGLLDYEVNSLTKLLFAAVVVLAFAMICLKGFSGYWYIYWFRYVLLFSYIIPISLRVNLEMGRVVYSQMIQRDMEIAGTLARTTTIPEDLGRISYLLTDKTGTLTKNEMIFKKIHFGRMSYSQEYFDEVTAILRAYYNTSVATSSSAPISNYQTHRRESSTASTSSFTLERRRHMRVDSYEVDREIVYRVQQAVLAIALCHNVTPAYENQSQSDDPNSVNIPMKNMGIMYHASSPDEVALVQWTEKVGLTLIFRDIRYITLCNPYGQKMNFEILDIFPFSSETKRMGIIVRDLNTKEIVFYLKGADTVMSSIITYSDWLQEQCDNMARSGLRTLVVAKKILDEDQFNDFQDRYNQAKCNMNDRSARIRAVLATLEKDMELICLTGVEDRLQDGVATTLKGLQDAGIKLWMLTGDKLETAISIAKSSQLVKKMQEFYVFRPVKTRTEVHLELNNFHRKSDCPLVIRGEDLELCMKFYVAEFMDLATQCPAVVCCRCSPTQKAEVVKMIQLRTKKRTCAVGDGGNDVSMIQTANVGIGIVGKEGQQASLAADFSILQFSYIYHLILLHGRYSYKRSATLSQFIIHRGLIISTLQAIFSSAFYFASVPLYQGFLMIGYATFYTMFPVFSIVLDKDVSPRLVMKFPELYKLMKGRSLSYKTFFIWVLISIYQGSVIMYGSILLFNDEFIHVVAITFTAVILTELLMLALTVRTWHWLMIVAELISFSTYLLTLILAPQFFDEKFIQSRAFLWKVTLMTLVSCLPLYVLKFLHRKIAPPSHHKLN